MKLQDIIRQVASAPGQYSATEQYDKVMALCDEWGISTTLDEVKREFRDLAGYP